jgi:hypothetical protein
MTTASLLQKGALSTAGLTLMLLGTMGSAHAATLTFDDLSTADITQEGLYMPETYAGFQWDNFAYDSTPPPGSGFAAGVVSPSTILFNGFGDEATVRRTTTFDFTSAYLAAGWRDGLSLLVEGFSGTTQTYSRSLVLSKARATLVNFDFLNVDRVRFSSSGGPVNPNPTASDGTHFVLDNFAFNPDPVRNVQAVPEPTTMAGLTLAGAGMLALKRKGKRSGKVTL